MQFDRELVFGTLRAHVIAKELAESDPRRTQFQMNLARTYYMLGERAANQARSEEALGFFRQGLAIVEALGERQPGNAIIQKTMADFLQRIGDQRPGRDEAQGAPNLLDLGKSP